MTPIFPLARRAERRNSPAISRSDQLHQWEKRKSDEVVLFETHLLDFANSTVLAIHRTVNLNTRGHRQFGRRKVTALCRLAGLSLPVERNDHIRVFWHSQYPLISQTSIFTRGALLKKTNISGKWLGFGCDSTHDDSAHPSAYRSFSEPSKLGARTQHAKGTRFRSSADKVRGVPAGYRWSVPALA